MKRKPYTIDLSSMQQASQLADLNAKAVCNKIIYRPANALQLREGKCDRFCQRFLNLENRATNTGGGLIRDLE
ncbi:hypothetical protein LXJ59_27260, partial [Escherichia coli]|nr:hypothetical protein [Escherichia coli]